MMFRDLRFSFLGLAAAAAIGAPSSAALAYDFQPMVAEFAPSGPGATRSFVIRNTQQAPIALQIESFKRTQGPDGAEIRTPDDDFLITPPQTVVPPGSSQNVRAQWLGPAPKKELAFRFIVKQLPISYQAAATNAEKTASVSIGYTYEAAVYVTPPDAKPGARLVGVAPATGPKGEKLLRVTLESTGDTRAIIDQPKLSLRPQAGGAAVTLTADQLKPMENFVVLVDTQRSIDLPWPDKLPFGPATAEFSSQYYDVS